MAKIVKILTSSFATLENTMPPYNIRIPSCEEDLQTAYKILDMAKEYSPDIVLLPETFKNAGRSIETYANDSETIDGQVINFLSAKAFEGHYNLVAGILLSENQHLSNEAIIFDRNGKIAGRYVKNYPVEAEIQAGIIPGNSIPTFDLDFGRIGVAICFDINWRNIWNTFKDKEIDFACWISAYEGGNLLSQYAQWYKYPIVSSVWPYHSKVIDIMGNVPVKTSRWNRLAYYEMNLDRELFHTDLQMDKINDIEKKYGNDILIQAFTEENLFLLTNYRSDCTIKDIEKEFNLVSYKKYIERCTVLRDQTLFNKV